MAEPAFQHFTIAQKAEGDYISGLNFTLHPRDAEEAPAEADLFASFGDWPADETTAALDSSAAVPATDEEALFDAFFKVEEEEETFAVEPTSAFGDEHGLEERPVDEVTLDASALVTLISDEAVADELFLREDVAIDTTSAPSPLDAESTPDEAGPEEPFPAQQPLPGVYDLPAPQDTWPPTFRDWRDVYRRF